jgi:hypothetical protein
MCGCETQNEVSWKASHEFKAIQQQMVGNITPTKNTHSTLFERLPATFETNETMDQRLSENSA